MKEAQHAKDIETICNSLAILSFNSGLNFSMDEIFETKKEAEFFIQNYQRQISVLEEQKNQEDFEQISIDEKEISDADIDKFLREMQPKKGKKAD